jgi:hypothetical protein
MKRSADDAPELLKRRRSLQQAISELGDFRPGQLTERYRRCGKPNCHCANPGDPGHGPSWSLTRVVAGKTVTRIIPAGPAVASTQAQLAEYRQFRELTHELVEVSEALCEVRLANSAAASEAEKKKGSKTPSTKRSRPKPNT